MFTDIKREMVEMTESTTPADVIPKSLKIGATIGVYVALHSRLGDLEAVEVSQRFRAVADNPEGSDAMVILRRARLDIRGFISDIIMNHETLFGTTETFFFSQKCNTISDGRRTHTSHAVYLGVFLEEEGRWRCVRGYPCCLGYAFGYAWYSFCIRTCSSSRGDCYEFFPIRQQGEGTPCHF